MQLNRLSIVLICLLAFTLIVQNSVKNDFPLSWDVWYHLRISRQFSQGDILWDSGSFAPQGRAHTYPPLFHGMTAFLYTITSVPLETLAVLVTPFLFALAIYSFYVLVKEVFNHKVALISCLFASVSPLLLDRGLSYTPEALSFIFFNFGLVSFWKGRWKTAGILGGMLVLTHGLSSVAFLFVILFYTFWSYVVLRENTWKLFFQVFLLSLVIPAVWALRSFPSFIPQGFVYPLSLYPEKLGWIQILLAFIGLTCLSKDKKSVFTLSFAGSLFLLSQYSVSLPYRFTEYLVFPVCMLAGIGYMNVRNLNKKVDVLVILFLLSFAQGYWYIEKYQPVVSSEEATTFSWMNSNSVESTVFCEWRTAPVLAFFSGRPPVKGAYQFGAPQLVERTEDTQLFYTEYPGYLMLKYDVSYVYYGIEEKKYGYELPPFDKVYSTLKTGFYHQ